MGVLKKQRTKEERGKSTRTSNNLVVISTWISLKAATRRKRNELTVGLAEGSWFKVSWA
jgi:hypothetical protein